MSTKEIQDKIIHNMERWQKIEDASVAQMSEIIASTDNPVIRMVMEIIMHDSQNHRRVQELIVKSLTSEAVNLNPEELDKIWSMVDKHAKMEKTADELAKVSLEAIQGKKMVVQEYLIRYLVEDEEKHDRLLDNLEKIKSGMYPYG